MIDQRHSLATLAGRMPWLKIDALLASQLARQAYAGKPIEALNLFGAQNVVVVLPMPDNRAYRVACGSRFCI